MKKLFGLLNIILCFELLMGPMLHSGGIISIQSAMAQDCPAGTSFDSTLNRCLTSEQTSQVMNAVANCKGSQACYKQTAEDALKKAEEEGKVTEQLANKAGLFNTSMKAASVALPLTIAAGALFKTGPKCLSIAKIAMVGAGAALFGGDMISNMLHKNRLKKIKKEWEGILSTDTSSGNGTTTTSTTPKATEAQSQAFEMLAKSEDSMASAAKMKAGFFGVATAAFAAAAVMSTMEIIELRTKHSAAYAAGANPALMTAYIEASNRINCLNEPLPETLDAPTQLAPLRPTVDLIPLPTTTNLYKLKNESLNNIKNANSLAAFYTLMNFNYSFESRMSPSLDEYQANVSMLKDSGVENDKPLLNLIKKISLQVLAGINPLPQAHAQGGVGALASRGLGIVKGLPQALQKPMPRAIIAGVFAAWAGTMTLHALKQAKVSSNRAEYLRKIKTDFNDASTAIGSCTDAQRASPTTPSCYCYTAEGRHNPERESSAICTALFTGKNISGVETSYLTDSSNVGICVTSEGATDSTCACRSTNSCAGASTSGLTGLSSGSFSMLNSPLSALGSLGAGKTDAATVNGSASVANALRLLDAANNLAAKDPSAKAMLKNKSKIANDFANAATAAGAGTTPSFLGNSSGGNLNMNPSQAIEELQKEFKEAESPIRTANGGGTLPSPGTPGQAEDIDFGFAANNPAQETQLAEAMKEDLDYGQNDIKTSDGSIFEAVSNRYQQSGMRRLFEDKKKPALKNN